jgi:BirA family biotin operon repressor/biotin-[acetyl-CoA-carboxylase] ligase
MRQDSSRVGYIADYEAIWFHEIRSTNSVLADELKDYGLVALSWDQTHGRGRLGREWTCKRNKSLAFSVSLKRELIPEDLGTPWLGALSLSAGLSVREAIAPFISEQVTLKWPNDVLIAGKKVAGILGELTDDGRVILGVGINVFHREGELPTRWATSLHLHGFSPNISVEVIVEGFLRALQETLSGHDGTIQPESLDYMRSFSDTLGRRVRISFHGGSHRDGRAIDFDEFGRLLVHFDDSEDLHTVSSADIVHLRS